MKSPDFLTSRNIPLVVAQDLPHEKPAMARVTALKHAEQCLANIATKNVKYNIFVAQRNVQKVLEDIQESAESNKGKHTPKALVGYLGKLVY